MLEATGLTRIYRIGDAEVRAVDQLDLAIETGQMIALMGPSGCGKSTLLHLLGGLDRPDAGQLLLNGRRIDNLSETQWARLRRHEIGYMFQFFNLIGSLTVADNIELPGLVAGLSAGEARRRRRQLLDELELSDKAAAVPAMLSGGQQQRVALARALINEPALLLADEPTGNLDTQAGREILALLRGYNERGQTILLATHDAKIASGSDRVVTMRDGRIRDDTPLSMGPRGVSARSLPIQLEA
jgi:putative ABC transport system ATP-binding protein